jgi:GxxExxY protein
MGEKKMKCLFSFPPFSFPKKRRIRMPIHVGAEIRRMGDEEFKARVYEVMGHVFDMHRELGRLLHEKIYQREVAFRLADAQREVPVEVRFEDFSKTYYLDLLIGGGVIIELKAVEALAQRHQRQLMHYLFLTGLPHGKLVNMRPEQVEQVFVNNVLSTAARTSFATVDDGWQEIETRRFKDRMTGALRDWGVGLDLGLYEEAASHLCGQPADEEAEVGISLGPRGLGTQRMRLAAPGVALRITALPPQRHAEYHASLLRLLDHAELTAVQWINITQAMVEFRTVWKRR